MPGSYVEVEPVLEWRRNLALDESEEKGEQSNVPAAAREQRGGSEEEEEE